jgi:hypothetical protein
MADTQSPRVPAGPPGAPRDSRARLRAWLRRIGIVGFLFFLAKGIAWLTVTYFLVTV